MVGGLVVMPTRRRFFGVVSGVGRIWFLGIESGRHRSVVFIFGDDVKVGG